MDYYCFKTYENTDRNKLDKEIREWADKNINQMIIKNDTSESFMVYLSIKINRLNAAHPYVKKKLELSVRSRSENEMYISFSPYLQYKLSAVLRYYSPF